MENTGALWKRIQDHRGEKPALWWLGQMGFAIKLGEEVLLIDPFLSPRADRAAPPRLRAQELAGVRWVLGTHDHDDHIDRAAWETLARVEKDCVFVAPGMHVDSLAREQGIPGDRLQGLDDGESLALGGVTVRALAAAHELLEPVEGRYPCLSYLLEWRGKKLFHAGDACLYEGLAAKLRAFGRLDLMILPINGRDAKRLGSGCIGNMTYQEAVDLAGLLRPRAVIPGHYDMFAHNGEDPELFRAYLELKYPGIACILPAHGELVEL